MSTILIGKFLSAQSDIWMEKYLKLSMDAALYSEVMVEYDELPEEQRGSISLFRLIVNRMVTQSEEARRHLLRYIEEFDIRTYPGEDVSLACVRLKEITRALGQDSLPRDLISRVLDGFSKASSETFRLMCSTQRVNFLSRFTRPMLGNMSLSVQLTNLLRDLEDSYRDLKAGGKWDGAGRDPPQASSAFNAVSDAQDDTDGDEYSIYKASARTAKVPFHQWVKTATCHYCKRVGHIQPDCNKFKADKAKGIYNPVANNTTNSPPTSSSPAATATPDNRKPYIPARFRNSPHLKALQAAIDDVVSSTDGDNGDMDGQATDDDVTELMCALGLKD